jgi:tetratricopeptide (TPR) repeat protein
LKNSLDINEYATYNRATGFRKKKKGTYLMTAGSSSPPSSELVQLVEQAEASFLQNDFASAQAYINRALLIDPNFTSSLMLRGMIALFQGQLTSAVRDFDQVTTLEPNHAWAYARRSTAYMGLQNVAAALTDATKAIQLDPTIPQAYSIRGRLLLYNNDPKQALTDLNKAIELDPENGDHYCWRGQVYDHINQPAKAVADFQSALKYFPSHSLAANMQEYIKENRTVGGAFTYIIAAAIAVIPAIISLYIIAGITTSMAPIGTPLHWISALLTIVGGLGAWYLFTRLIRYHLFTTSARRILLRRVGQGSKRMVVNAIRSTKRDMDRSAEMMITGTTIRSDLRHFREDLERQFGRDK